MSAYYVFPALSGKPSEWIISMFFLPATHATLNDGVSSMEAHIVFLVNSHHISCPLTWQAMKRAVP